MAPQSPSRSKPTKSSAIVIRVPKKLFFALFTLGLILCVCEVGQRISNWRKFRKQASENTDRAWVKFQLGTGTGTRFPSDHATNGVTLFDPWLMVRPGPDQDCAGIHLNSLGMRGREWTKEKPAGTIRVAVVGGSTAFGYGVREDAKVYSGVLERALSAAAPAGAAVEVLNCGSLGYDAMQEAILLGARILDYAPDVVIALDGWNNFYNASLTPPEKDVPFPYFNELESVLDRGESFSASLLHFSAFARSIQGKIAGMREDDRRASGEFGRYYDYPRGVPLYRRQLEILCRIARGAGCKVILVTQPELEQRTPVPESEQGIHNGSGEDYARLAKARYPLYRDAAREVAKAEGALYGDATPIFNDVPDPVFPDRVHLNERGNELLAAHILPIVEKALGWDAAGK